MRWHAKWQSFNQKGIPWLETGPEDTSWSSTEVQRSAPEAEKYHAKQQPCRKQQALTIGARLQRSQQCVLTLAEDVEIPLSPAGIVLMKFHRLSTNYNLYRSPQTYPLFTHSLQKQHKICNNIAQGYRKTLIKDFAQNPENAAL